uniref:Uncharacterized protein n=1 Tax=Anguilla anguilla TaxID=7936 RepID=A0A0E9QSD9_ANGAN
MHPAKLESFLYITTHSVAVELCVRD